MVMRNQFKAQQIRQEMYKLAFILFVIGVTALFLLTGCSNEGSNVSFTPNQPPVSVLTRPATPTECAAGGTVVTVGGQDNVICNGANGANGSNGLNGQNGADGTQIAFVQFCSGTPSYASTFPEVGVAVGNKVYAVYSVNGGFLTYLPPGLYQSTGIGSGQQCTFTINSDGTVSH